MLGLSGLQHITHKLWKEISSSQERAPMAWRGWLYRSDVGRVFVVYQVTHLLFEQLQAEQPAANTVDSVADSSNNFDKLLQTDSDVHLYIRQNAVEAPRALPLIQGSTWSTVLKISSTISSQVTIFIQVAL